MPRIVFCYAVLLALVPVVRADEPKKEPAAKPPTFKAPKGWHEVERGKNDLLGITVAARFQSGEGEKTVAVVVISASGGLAPNVNRWRGQVGLKSLEDEAALKTLEAIKVDGLTAHLLDVTGPASADKPAQRIVAVIVSSGDTTWFIKMSGANTPVGEQKAAFNEFVKSIRFAK